LRGIPGGGAERNDTSHVFPVYEEKIWGRKKSISHEPAASSLSEAWLSREQDRDPVLDRDDTLCGLCDSDIEDSLIVRPVQNIEKP
jgi:hypothetical protein